MPEPDWVATSRLPRLPARRSGRQRLSLLATIPRRGVENNRFWQGEVGDAPRLPPALGCAIENEAAGEAEEGHQCEAYREHPGRLARHDAGIEIFDHDRDAEHGGNDGEHQGAEAEEFHWPLFAHKADDQAQDAHAVADGIEL